MNILVVSDTHGDTDTLYEIISRGRAWCDVVIHLGDKMRDIRDVMLDFPNIAWLCVVGNCDFSVNGGENKYEGCFNAEGKRIFYTHGHKYNVKLGTEYLAYTAKKNGADIALFGHTHKSFVGEVGGILVINPGSLSQPRDGKGGSYAKISICNNNVKWEICEVNS